MNIANRGPNESGRDGLESDTPHTKKYASPHSANGSIVLR
jgi:hypothetical protein